MALNILITTESNLKKRLQVLALQVMNVDTRSNIKQNFERVEELTNEFSC